MWRALCVTVLLPSLAAAQSETAEAAQAAPTPHDLSAAASPIKPLYSSYTYYNEIRQGTREDIAIQVAVPGFLTLPGAPAPDILPLQLELQPAEGFTPDKIRYPKTYQRRFAFAAEPIRVTSTSFPIQFGLRADRNAALGLHTLAGRLTFQIITDKGGPGPVQVVDLQIPVTVVDHDAKATKGQWPVHKLPTPVLVLLIVLSPILVALVIPIYLICGVTGNPGCG